jgi:iron complex outermembrane receptor protein
MLYGRQFCNFDVNDYYEAQSKGTDVNLLSKITFKLGENLTSFTEIGFSRVEREYVGLPKTISSTAPTTVFRVNGLPTSYQLLLPSGHPDNPLHRLQGRGRVPLRRHRRRRKTSTRPTAS